MERIVYLAVDGYNGRTLSFDSKKVARQQTEIWIKATHEEQCTRLIPLGNKCLCMDDMAVVCAAHTYREATQPHTWQCCPHRECVGVDKQIVRQSVVLP